MPVAELFMWIGQCRKTGTLRVSLPKSEHTIAFHEGRLIFCASSDLEQSLGRVLIHQGRLTRELHDMALKVRDESAIGIGKILTDLQVVEEKDLLAALTEKTEGQILDLLLAEEGAFRFNLDVPQLELVPVDIDLTRAILAVTHRMDQSANQNSAG